MEYYFGSNCGKLDYHNELKIINSQSEIAEFEFIKNKYDELVLKYPTGLKLFRTEKSLDIKEIIKYENDIKTYENNAIKN